MRRSLNLLKGHMTLQARSILGGVALAATLAVGSASAQTPTITTGALVYSQYGIQFHTDSVTNRHLNAFDITRAYLNVVGKFTDGVGIRVTPDIYRVTDGSLAFRLKYAYATWTPEKSPLTAKFGLIHTPWLDWEEALWDYRMQGSMAMERFRSAAGAGYLSSADFGAGVDGKFGFDKVNFQIGAYDGEFYSKPEGDSYKDLEARVSVRVLETDDHSRVGGLRLTGYGGIGTPTGGGRRNRYIGMVSYKSKLFTLAGEYGRARDRLDNLAPVTGTPAPAPVPLTDSDVLSFFGVLNVPNSKLGIIGRYDLQKPNVDVADNKQERLIAGLSYQLTPQVRVLGDIDNFWTPSGIYTNAVNSTRTTGFIHMQFAF
jgi:hypothetical protein